MTALFLCVCVPVYLPCSVPPFPLLGPVCLPRSKTFLSVFVLLFLLSFCFFFFGSALDSYSQACSIFFERVFVVVLCHTAPYFEIYIIYIFGLLFFLFLLAVPSGVSRNPNELCATIGPYGVCVCVCVCLLFCCGLVALFLKDVEVWYVLFFCCFVFCFFVSDLLGVRWVGSGVCACACGFVV